MPAIVGTSSQPVKVVVQQLNPPGVFWFESFGPWSVGRVMAILWQGRSGPDADAVILSQHAKPVFPVR